VPGSLRSLAFVDMEIPIGHGEFMMTPKMEARILQELTIQPSDRILEIGTGSGYLTALLATLGQHVTSVDIIPEFTTHARAKLLAHHITNVSLETGDAALDWPSHAAYDVIVLTGSTPVLPQNLLNRLSVQGRLFAITGDAPAMIAQCITRTDSNNWRTRNLFETVIKPLQHAMQPERFVF
jgi:protein-L-isoaspartate(D-aspartate) O-methyltransferase